MSARVIANVEGLSRAEWLDLRRQGIGGSDAGAVMGMSPWASPLSVYCDKVGLTPDREASEAMDFGNLMEPVIRDWFRGELKKKGVEARVERCSQMFQSNENPWMLANLDGRVWSSLGPVILEIKTSDARSAKQWGTEAEPEVPDQYYAQVQHYMAVMGYDGAYIVCLLGRRIIYRWVPRNDPFIATLIETEKVFWEGYVKANVTPLPTGLDVDGDLMTMLFPGGSDEVVNAESLDEIMSRHVSLKDEIDLLEKERSAITNTIKSTLGNAKLGLGKEYKATWSRFEKQTIDLNDLRLAMPDVAKQFTKTSTSGRLTVAKIKGKKVEE